MLVIYARVRLRQGAQRRGELRSAMQRAIGRGLNPLFKVHDVVPVESLPRTPSNKILRRVLRAEYEKQLPGMQAGFSAQSRGNTAS